MPTYGWIQESSWDAFLEGTQRTPDPGPPSPPTFRCPFCDSILSSPAQLQNHVSGDHFVARPILLIGGIEPTETSVIRSPRGIGTFFIANATNAEIEVDGGAQVPIAVTGLARELSKLKQGEISISLSNTSQVRAMPVTTHYDISFRIADAAKLRNVEAAFSERIMSSTLSRALIEHFLHDPRCRHAGSDYAEGLASFTLGVLLKERPSSEYLTTPFARYRESYGSSLRILDDIQRPFARLISNVVRFALNDFTKSDAPTGYWELDLATALLRDPELKDLPCEPGPETLRREVCPVDHGTGQILDLAVRMFHQTRWSPILNDECRQVTNSDVLDVMDRQKALAIWAIAAWRLGAKEQSVEPLRQISATFPFKSWAEPYLETVLQ
jgi:hypothetical protein